MIVQLFRKLSLTYLALLVCFLISPINAQETDLQESDSQVAPVDTDVSVSLPSNNLLWKSSSAVRSALGEPQTIVGPVGTHASYQLWRYPQFTVAFSNERVFHMFGPVARVSLNSDN